jgi:Icc-related predicted phosphoesterase
MAADVLVLAGDICVATDVWPYDDEYVNTKSLRIHKFFMDCSREFEHIIYVLGNHEHYHGDIATSIKQLKENLKYIPNLHIIERGVVEINGVLFLGSTLWTNMNEIDQETLHHVKWGMNDFTVIKNSNVLVSYKVPVVDDVDREDLSLEAPNHKSETRTRPAKWSPEDAIVEFNKTVQWIDCIRALHKDRQLVMISHHSPSFQSVSPIYENHTLMNGGYCSNLESFIEDRPEIKLWFHGHLHNLNDYTVGQTRVLANPRGYAGYEARADEFELLFVDL